MAMKPRLELRGVHKRYARRRVLCGIDLTVHRGEIVGLTGPNGGGKTTALRIAAGLLAPDAGWVELDGARLDPRRPRQRVAVGYLPEGNPLYGALTARSYLQFAARARGLDPAELRRAVDRAAAECHIQAVLGERIGHLSKGFRQRVGLAGARIGDPEILLLDEATGGLDPREAAATRDALRRGAAERAVLLCTHVPSEARELCSRIAYLDAGRISTTPNPRGAGGDPATPG